MTNKPHCHPPNEQQLLDMRHMEDKEVPTSGCLEMGKKKGTIAHWTSEWALS